MKKALVAAAVAGAFAAPSLMAAELSTNIYWSTAVTAQETTTTSGGVDSTVGQDGISDGGGNRLMFTWTDTLDNGVGVTAYLSFGNLDTAGVGAVNIRNSNIGFNGEFGTVQVGTNEHFSETDLIFDPSYADFGATGDALSFIQMGTTGFNFTRRDGESIWYTSNSMNGLQLRAVYVMGPAAASDANADADGTQIGLTYSSGAMTFGVNQATYNDYANDGGSGAPVAGSEATMTTLRASYDLGMLTIKAAMWDIEQTGLAAGTADETGTAINGLEVAGRSIYVGMPVGGGTLWAQSSKLGDQDASAVAGGTQAVDASDKSGWDIGYHMPMNANVNFFARYGESETGVNFDTTAGSTETEMLMFGWMLIY